MNMAAQAARDEFLLVSVWHGSLDRSEAILAAHPEIADGDIHVAAVLGDDAAIARFIARDPAAATSRSGPRGWDALTYLCFSKYLRLDPSRSDAFVRAARGLLEAGASVRTGFWEPDHEPEPEWESVMYGAAGVAHHPELTRLLLECGADPNDEETPYHAPETYDNRALARHATVALLVERGAAIDMTDGQGRTPLMLAVRACVDSYWTRRRSPESVAALLKAGASVHGVPFPSGYAEVDALVAAHGAKSGWSE